MTTTESECAERLGRWNNSWDVGQIGFHRQEVHRLLKEQFGQLFTGGDKKAFVPLCGKSVDMAWLAEQGITVVGVEGVPVALEQFFSEQSIKYGKESAPKLGVDATLYKSEDNKIRLYCGDMMNFDENVEGCFSGIWDRGSLVALDRQDVPKYVSIIKQLLVPGGRCLLETVYYDVSIMSGINDVPPPHPMAEADVKSLYEPECTVEYLGKNEIIVRGKPINTLNFLITKKS